MKTIALISILLMCMAAMAEDSESMVGVPRHERNQILAQNVAMLIYGTSENEDPRFYAALSACVSKDSGIAQIFQDIVLEFQKPETKKMSSAERSSLIEDLKKLIDVPCEKDFSRRGISAK